MADHAHDGDDPVGARGAQRRLPYQKPTIKWEQPLELRPELMAGCSKQSTSDPQCDMTLMS